MYILIIVYSCFTGFLNDKYENATDQQLADGVSGSAIRVRLV